MFNMFKKAAISNRAEETILYECVMDELEEGIKIRGLWGKALAKSDGDMSKAESLYMKYRVQDIKDFLTAMKIAYDEMPKNEVSQIIDLERRKEEIAIPKENTKKENKTNKNISNNKTDPLVIILTVILPIIAIGLEFFSDGFVSKKIGLGDFETYFTILILLPIIGFIFAFIIRSIQSIGIIKPIIILVGIWISIQIFNWVIEEDYSLANLAEETSSNNQKDAK